MYNNYTCTIAEKIYEEVVGVETSGGRFSYSGIVKKWLAAGQETEAHCGVCTPPC